MGIPVEVSAVNDAAADSHRMSVHIFCGRMGHNICAPLERTAVDRCRERIIHDKRHPMSVGYPGKLLNVENDKSRVRDRLTKYHFCIRAERLLDLLLRCVRIHQCHIDPLFLHCHCKQVGGSAVDRRCADNMVTRIADIEGRIVVRRLSGRCEHRSHSAFQLTDLFRYRIIRRVRKSCIEIAIFLQIEQSSHLLARLIFKSCALINRKNSRLSVLWFPSALDTDRCRFSLFSHDRFLHYV